MNNLESEIKALRNQMRNDKRNKAVNELRQKIDELKKLQNELLNKINHNNKNELMMEKSAGMKLRMKKLLMLIIMPTY